jgi:hypothetical protein
MERALWVALVWLTACGGGEKQRRELVDDGQVCVRLEPSGAVHADVLFRDCLTSCDVAQPASCSVTKQVGEDGADVVLVASHGVVETTGASVCTTTCGQLTASCVSTELFAPGMHTVRHGLDQGEVTLGSQARCVFAD